MAYNLYITWLLSAQILVQVAKSGAEVPAIIVFGDSSVDTGNNNHIPTILKGNFKPYGRDFPGGQPTGRFSNGRVPPDFISKAFGLKPTIPAYLDPKYGIQDFATGVCFASAGTGYDNATSDLFGAMPLWKEVEYYKEYQSKLRAYLGHRKANIILREALYLVSIGTNDFLENYYLVPGRRIQFTVQQYEDFLVGLAANFFTKLYHLGVRKIALTGVPPMGCLPLERTTNLLASHDCVEEYNNVAVEFNGKLNNMVARLNQELPGLRMLFTGKTYPLFYQIIRNPSSYGFDVAEVACCGSGRFEIGYLCNQLNPFTCKDANKYVFWDAIHPSEKTNQIIANDLMVDFLKIYK